MQDYCLCLRRAPWLDCKRTNADPHYINAELRTVSYQAFPRGTATRTEIGVTAAIESFTICTTSCLKTTFETRVHDFDSEEFEENYFY